MRIRIGGCLKAIDVAEIDNGLQLPLRRERFPNGIAVDISCPGAGAQEGELAVGLKQAERMFDKRNIEIGSLLERFEPCLINIAQSGRNRIPANVGWIGDNVGETLSWARLEEVFVPDPTLCDLYRFDTRDIEFFKGRSTLPAKVRRDLPVNLVGAD